jgi:hypothetical protein
MTNLSGRPRKTHWPRWVESGLFLARNMAICPRQCGDHKQTLSANLNNSPDQHQNSPADETVDASGLCVVETLICSGRGETLYASPGLAVSARLSLLQSINRQAASLEKLLPLGSFDRLEIQLDGSRAVAQLRNDRMVFVRVATGETKPQETA